MTRHGLPFLLILVLVFLHSGCGPRVHDYTTATDTSGIIGSQGPVADSTTLGPLTLSAPTFTAEGIRVATLNAEFMFDGLEPDGEATFAWKDDSLAAANHRRGIGDIVAMLDVDIIMFQEIENEFVLQMMIDESLSDTGYEAYFVQGFDSFTRQNVGLISRIPVEECGRIDERERVEGTRQEYGVSKNMWARLEIEGIPTTIIGLHFLAQPDNVERAPRREAQARVIYNFAQAEADAGRELIILGDFNDFDGEVPDRKGSRPITNVLSTIKSAGDGMINVMGEVHQQDRFTTHWDRNNDGRVTNDELSAIDHLLISTGLYLHLVDVQFVHAHNPMYGPDHFPIVVTLQPGH